MGRQSSARQLVVIMFTDMVGYAALVQRNEGLALQLVQRQRDFVRASLSRYGGREVEVIGDAFLIEFSSALRAAECAIALQKRIHAASADAPEAERFLIRIGLHLGDIERPGKGVFGDSVNIAARVQAQAPHGGIAVSGPVHDQIRNKLAVPFRPLGPTTLKNIDRPVELFVLDPDAIIALPDPTTAAVPPTGVPRPSRRIGQVSGAIAAAAAVMVALWHLTPPANPPDKSLAVLPFSNLSEDPAANDYFVGGVHESILTHLSRVEGLKVISRTSVMEYKNRERNLKDIGKALGVGHIVEGSVLKVGNRVRVTAQLIEAQTDRHLWAEEYDRDLVDVLSIQSDVAKRVVAAVHTRLSHDTAAQIERRPTENAEAYDLYLQARKQMWEFPNEPAVFFRIETLLDRALELDPDFALAYATLAFAHAAQYWISLDPTAERRDKAKAAIEEALRIDPESPEVRLAYGYYLQFGLGDPEHALRELELAAHRLPNSADILSALAGTLSSQNRLDESLVLAERVRILDPRNPRAFRDLAGYLRYLHRYAEADAAFEQALLIKPDDINSRLARAYLRLAWKGDLEFVRETLADIPPGVDPANFVSETRVWLALYDERFEDAFRLVSAIPGDTVTLAATRFPSDVRFAQILMYQDKPDEARRFLLRARDQLKDKLAREHDHPRSAPAAHALLAEIYAHLGNKESALAEIHKAAGIIQASGNHVLTNRITPYLARVHMLLGDHDRALDLLAPLLAVGRGAYAHEVRLNPAWIPLRGNPRFQKLIADNLPKDG